MKLRINYIFFSAVIALVLFLGGSFLDFAADSSADEISIDNSNPAMSEEDIVKYAGDPSVIIITGYVKDGTTGINGAYVVAVSTVSAGGNYGNYSDVPANSGQCRTFTKDGQAGYFSITLPTYGNGSQYGTIEVFHKSYTQTNCRGVYTWLDSRNEAYVYNISVSLVAKYPEAKYIGLRESYYGLTRPSVQNWPTNLTPVGNPPLFDYNDNYDDLVDYWATSNDFNWKPVSSQTVPKPKPTHILIVTQTEPNFDNEGEWATETYHLWEQTGFDCNRPGYIYLGELTEQGSGDQLDEDKVDIDALLNAYDAKGHDVFIQIESGSHADTIILKCALNRFYRRYNSTTIKHPCIKGFGVDVEWYGDSDPNEDGESISVSGVNGIYNILKGWGHNLKLFLKHWDRGQAIKQAIPTASQGLKADIIVIDDSQGFDNDFATQKSEFKAWLDFYSPNPVGFQIGYPADYHWWKNLGGKKIDKNVTGLLKYFGTANGARNIGFVWVDFSVRYPEINAGKIEEHIPPN
jgi:hypothetical protein